MIDTFSSVGFYQFDDLLGMSNACDPRNRPGYIPGDLEPFLEPASGAEETASDAVRTLILAWLSAALIVACVVSLVHLS